MVASNTAQALRIERDADVLYRTVLREADGAGGVTTVSWRQLVESHEETRAAFGHGKKFVAERVQQALDRLLATDRIVFDRDGSRLVLHKDEYAPTQRRGREPAPADPSSSAPRIPLTIPSDAGLILAREWFRIDLDPPLPSVEHLGSDALAEIVKEEVASAQQAIAEIAELSRQAEERFRKAEAHSRLAHRLIALLNAPPADET